MLQSNTSFTLLSKINITDTTGGTFTISNENENDTPIDTDWEQVSIVFSNKRQRERLIVTIVNNVCTIVSRGLSQKWGAASTTLQKQWLEGTVWYMTALDFDIFEKDSGETQIVSADAQFTGALSTIWEFSASDIRFTGTTTSWLRTKSLTIAQRIALTAENGDLVYDTDLWELYQYVWGAWSAVSAGSTQANASTTVAGKVELATAAERAAWTATGWTGATLIPTNDALVKTSSGASDENKIPVLNSNGKVDVFVTQINERSSETTLADDDEDIFYDTSAGVNKKITQINKAEQYLEKTIVLNGTRWSLSASIDSSAWTVTSWSVLISKSTIAQYASSSSGWNSTSYIEVSDDDSTWSTLYSDVYSGSGSASAIFMMEKWKYYRCKLIKTTSWSGWNSTSLKYTT